MTRPDVKLQAVSTYCRLGTPLSALHALNHSQPKNESVSKSPKKSRIQNINRMVKVFSFYHFMLSFKFW